MHPPTHFLDTSLSSLSAFNNKYTIYDFVDRKRFRIYLTSVDNNDFYGLNSSSNELDKTEKHVTSTKMTSNFL